MTLDDAFRIQLRLPELEFPTIFSVSVFFALFKTYGIPSISKLLVATGQLSNGKTASKRAADTGVILTEVVLHHPLDPRAMDGIARMNYLHGLYRKSGKISDDDMLYTLSLFALEPIRWTKQFEWRQVNDVERCAIGTYWRYMGDAMEIPFNSLKSYETGWADGLQFIDDLAEWSVEYEAKAMVPAESNKVVAQGTIDIGLFNVPKFLHGVALSFVAAVLQPHLRRAMMFPDPPEWAIATFTTIVTVRKFVLRHFFLPRPYFLRDRWWSEHPNTHGRINAKQFISLPWYIEPTFAARWGYKAWLLRLIGSKVPGDDGDSYEPKGYVISELGPDSLRHKGAEQMKTTRDALANGTRVGCPFSRW
ncbi:uncharacterized protein MYCFIDRAFT_166377 [Pseudocercospora fijiensis CIRAD86]|uniref:ER-bound oxygenase mpaB/mpaB'/Rubber oxygenase catalytic domain-containing protein n=1 Tax=Pseudocercospora fijiensis (strain CIRAD86) TaxID=383855 RepID=M3A5Q0_PSEFD|nr:uncharacterized protein MYCFIDRAFT_166377 [Pseudocercospora fijiensis CIRAD86]EME79956.1 hypothetical protein MYCFIDRAFT_166377 [Pseudocercospora fijiensis CIRAD86]